MKSLADTTLIAQREQLRQQLLSQRRVIVAQLQPLAYTERAYPRSMTMRLLIRRPGLTVRVLGAVATLVLGARCQKLVNIALSVAGFAQTLPIAGTLQLAAPRQTTALRSD